MKQPVLEEHLIALGRWIASYYCAPIGEVLRVMTPLSGEMRSSKMYSLTDAGRDAARQLLFGAETEDPTIQVLRLLESGAHHPLRTLRRKLRMRRRRSGLC